VSEVRPAAFEWAAAGLPLAGQPVSGDAATVEDDRGDYLIAVVDGLGHGEAAADAASLAIDVIRANRAEPLDNLLVLCHQAMQVSRGAAITLARVDTVHRALTWVGVGNVDAFLVRNTPTGTAPVDSPVLAGGIVGFNLPRVTVRTVDLHMGDLIVFATDGIDPKFAGDLRLGMDVASLAEHIVSSRAKGTDDALALVTRFRGGDG
jgi:negative regulator of sigma-B (phosphoserine phosphatase)